MKKKKEIDDVSKEILFASKSYLFDMGIGLGELRFDQTREYEYGYEYEYEWHWQQHCHVNPSPFPSPSPSVTNLLYS